MPTNNAINLTTQGVVYYNGTGGSSAFAGLQQAAGQLLIGTSIAGAPTPNTLTAGTGISITSASGAITIALSGTGAVETLTGNSGGAISPTAGNINTLGSGSITIIGSGSTLTTELTGLTNHSLLVGSATTTLTNLGVATNGQLPIGSTGADPVLNTLTAGTGVSITNTAGSISIAVSATGVVQTLTGNSGGPISPTAGNINTLGSGSITIIGSGSTLTTELTGLTNHSLLVGSATTTLTNLGVATNGQLPIGSTGADPVLNTLTAGTGVSITNTAGSISIAVSATGVVQTLTGNSGGPISPTAGNINTLGSGSITIIGSGSTLTTELTGLTNHSLLVGSATTTLTNLGVATNGQLPIGSTGADPVLNTLTAGTGVTITNTAGSISIAATGGGLTWTQISASQTAAVNTGYFVVGASSGTVVLTLPTPVTPFGEVVAVTLDGTGTTAWQVAVPASTVIVLGDQNTTATTGTLTSTANGDTVTMVAQSATRWNVISSMGNLTWT